MLQVHKHKGTASVNTNHGRVGLNCVMGEEGAAHESCEGAFFHNNKVEPG